MATNQLTIEIRTSWWVNPFIEVVGFVHRVTGLNMGKWPCDLIVRYGITRIDPLGNETTAR